MKLTRTKAWQLAASAIIICLLAVYYFFFSKPGSFVKSWLEICGIFFIIVCLVAVMIKAFSYAWDLVSDFSQKRREKGRNKNKFWTGGRKWALALDLFVLVLSGIIILLILSAHESISIPLIIYLELFLFFVVCFVLVMLSVYAWRGGSPALPFPLSDLWRVITGRMPKHEYSIEE